MSKSSAASSVSPCLVPDMTSRSENGAPLTQGPKTSYSTVHGACLLRLQYLGVTEDRVAPAKRLRIEH